MKTPSDLGCGAKTGVGASRSSCSLSLSLSRVGRNRLALEESSSPPSVRPQVKLSAF